MKIYRVTKTRRPGFEHDGYEYYGNKIVAIKTQKHYNKKYEQYYDELSGEDNNQEDEVKTLEFTNDKAGIVDMLNSHCDIPNNG